MTAAPAPTSTTFAQRWALACLAATISEAATYPLDILKTRLQLQNERGRGLASAPPSSPPAAPPPLLSLRAMARHMVATEGPRALFAGLSVAVVRQLFNAGVSVGLYPTVRGALLGPEESAASAPLWKRALAGAATGCAAQALAQPADVVKVRVQADGRLRAAGLAPRYNGTGDAIARILREEGARGFYTALGSSVWRAGNINSAGIASYDGTKQWATARMGAGAWGGMGPQVVAALACGVVSTVVSCPLDVVKTRLMNARPGQYKGPNDCLLQLLRTEGAKSLFKGIVPTWQRQAAWNGIFWMSLEKVQRAFVRASLARARLRFVRAPLCLLTRPTINTARAQLF